MNTIANVDRTPMQPLGLDQNGTLRFKENRLVRWLAKNVPDSFNGIPYELFNQEELDQFAQLIGYSHGGFEELSYTSDEAYEVSNLMYRNQINEAEARAIYQEQQTAKVTVAQTQESPEPTVEIHIKGYRQSGKTLASDLIGKALQEAGFTQIKLVSQDNDFANRHGIEIQPLHLSHVNKDAIKFVIVDNNETPTLKGNE